MKRHVLPFVEGTIKWAALTAAGWSASILFLVLLLACVSLGGCVYNNAYVYTSPDSSLVLENVTFHQDPSKAHKIDATASVPVSALP